MTESIPDTNDLEVAMIAAAVHFVRLSVISGSRPISQSTKDFDEAYKAISQTVREARNAQLPLPNSEEQ